MPDSLEAVRKELARREVMISHRDTRDFPRWYAARAKRLGLDPNPDAPEHFYDYHAAFQAREEPDSQGHWTSRFKKEGHPRMVIDGVNTKTGQRVR